MLIRLVSDQYRVDIIPDGGDLFVAMTKAIMRLPTGEVQTNLHFEVDKAAQEAMVLEALRDPAAFVIPSEQLGTTFKNIPIGLIWP